MMLPLILLDIHIHKLFFQALQVTILYDKVKFDFDKHMTGLTI
jgi:hypothetical protein